MEYEKFLTKCYRKYKKEWCSERGYDQKKVEAANRRDAEYNGEMFVCLDEFEDNEFQEQEYMKSLLTPEEYKKWVELVGEEEP